MATLTHESDHSKAKELGITIAGDNRVFLLTASQQHPRQWSLAKKQALPIYIIVLEFFTAGLATTGSLVADVAAEGIGESAGWAYFTFTTMSLFGELAYIFSCFSPFSERYGRRQTYIIANVFLVVSLALTTSRTVAQIRFAWFLTGLLGMIPGSVACGTK